MILYRTNDCVFAEHGKRYWRVPGDWDDLFNRVDLPALLRSAVKGARSTRRLPRGVSLLPPIGSQEVWAAGVT